MSATAVHVSPKQSVVSENVSAAFTLPMSWVLLPLHLLSAQLEPIRVAAAYSCTVSGVSNE